MEFNGTWNSMEFRGIPWKIPWHGWKSMEFHGIEFH
jgi:hypothetical protein